MIYVFKNKEMPWASYGEILWQGIYYFDKKKKEHCLLRTAPFCPEIYFLNEIYLEPAILGEPENPEEVREKILWREILKEKSERMSIKDWQKWHGLKNKAQKLIEGMEDLKSENAKMRRKEKILLLLNQANEIYPLNTEKWMYGFWGEI